MDKKFGILIAAALIAFNVGCSSEKRSSALDSVQESGATPAPTPTGNVPSQYSGSAAMVTISSQAAIRKMFPSIGNATVSNVVVSIDLTRNSDSVILSFNANGSSRDFAFGIVHPDSGVKNNSYNKWVNQGGTQVWKGFFQDRYGAIVIVVDKFLSQGDGQSGNILGGSIWFQNFDRDYPNNPQQGPLKMCWEISVGPYDCRTFLSGNSVSMNSSYYPTNKGKDATYYYEKLGDFSGILKDSSGF